jgi:hypothetical protein
VPSGLTPPLSCCAAETEIGFHMFEPIWGGLQRLVVLVAGS